MADGTERKRLKLNAAGSDNATLTGEDFARLAAEAESAPGQVVPGGLLSGRYRLVRELGRGGMGVVFEVRDEELGMTLAVKVLPPEVGKNKAAVIRLKKEAVAAFKLAHPNIMALHHFERDGDVAYLVMELLDGENLEVLLAERGALPLAEVLDIARGVVAGLSEAHRQRIVHRDIKPANLMFKKTPAGKVIKICDFGIASEIKNTMTRLTGVEAAGTLLYCPPEQLKGKTPDPRADQYSLAAALYELLAGRPPFEGAGLAQQVLKASPSPIPDAPAPVNQALLRALAKAPEERFPDVESFLAALEGRAPDVAARQPAAAQPPAPQPVAPPPSAPSSYQATPATLSVGAGPLQPMSLAPLAMTLVPVPAGAFKQGHDDGRPSFVPEGPAHQVTLTHPFWMSRTPVTRDQWRLVMGSCEGAGAGDLPYDLALWGDAMEFCRLLMAVAAGAVPAGYAFRLPTEAEWEWAARAGAPDDRAPADLAAVAWFRDTSRAAPQPVGRLRANAWGLHDMLGDVWEWCYDWYADYPAAPQVDPWGPPTEGSGDKVSRGGDFLSEAWECSPGCRQGGLWYKTRAGFRVVLSAVRPPGC